MIVFFSINKMKKYFQFFNVKNCYYCNGYYGPNFNQPVCTVCHAFLYSNLENFQEKTDDCDSGNEEPKEPSDYYQMEGEIQVAAFSHNINEGNHNITPAVVSRDILQEQINMLTCPHPSDNVDPEILDRLPPEVLLLVFRQLDDITLWSVGQVCKRWNELVYKYVTEEEWQKYIKQRWPLYNPLFSTPCWSLLYTKLIESAPCLLCLHQMAFSSSTSNNENSWGKNRLLNEIKSLQSDPPEGILAYPLDKIYVQWQASIRGPARSPYEGGTFYLYIQIPPSYPISPPVVRFITKIFHPNVSIHGDIGIDSIRDNWSLALTISKILMSIQSLLTDPYTKVCMEPKIGRLYDNDIKEFEKIARIWTWKYAMHDALIPESNS